MKWLAFLAFMFAHITFCMEENINVGNSAESMPIIISENDQAVFVDGENKIEKISDFHIILNPKISRKENLIAIIKQWRKYKQEKEKESIDFNLCKDDNFIYFNFWTPEIPNEIEANKLNLIEFSSAMTTDFFDKKATSDTIITPWVEEVDEKTFTNLLISVQEHHKQILNDKEPIIIIQSPKTDEKMLITHFLTFYTQHIWGNSLPGNEVYIGEIQPYHLDFQFLFATKTKI